MKSVLAYNSIPPEYSSSSNWGLQSFDPPMIQVVRESKVYYLPGNLPSVIIRVILASFYIYYYMYFYGFHSLL